MSYFDEKARQTDVDTIIAFGVKIESRYAKATELSQMLMFTHMLATSDLHTYVKSVFYDSKACICTIELKDDSVFDSDAGDLIKACAEDTINQFQWNGAIYHSHALREWMKEHQV
ncbi:TPA: hypothetical protein P2Q98_001910 [Aeromonas veronii]|uniref:hypothetical protein n=1 Tax=Aeromonas veronii TaxID=654 RepID=UPI00330D129C|nr:hypothetical protein [Aeromonas veronii]HDO1333750.1 hypothetical protein [Aeromonas veronii]HDO1337444.1 hypothetical protein [Aeromonas veronii]HDO1342826.1 hypothetical protein [Aeromonas veronii]HDO1347165.1 hypothetical protein [Aeromonas veronii]